MPGRVRQYKLQGKAGGFFVVAPDQLILWVSAAALRLAQGKSAEETAALGCVFTQLGDTLTTMSVQQAANEAEAKKDEQPQTR